MKTDRADATEIFHDLSRVGAAGPKRRGGSGRQQESPGIAEGIDHHARHLSGRAKAETLARSNQSALQRTAQPVFADPERPGQTARGKYSTGADQPLFQIVTDSHAGVEESRVKHLK